MSRKTLILGLAAGFHYGDLRPFVTSLQQTGHCGECVLFVSSTTRDIERIQAHGVRCVPFQRPPEFAHVPYNAYRYFLYREFLRQKKATYHAILLTDTRDVIFQRDPFSFAWESGLNLALEDRNVKINDCPYMTRWIAHHLGAEIIQQLRLCNISCSGTSVGDEEAIRSYLEQMTRLLVPFRPGEQMAGYDQGVHNYLLHTGRLGKTAVYDNAGPILTLGYKRETPQIDSEGNVLNDSGLPAVLVHQYDRHKELFQQLRKRF